MINWKLRFQNKATLTAIVLGVISLVYTILELLDVIPPFPQEKIVTIASMIIDLLVLLGIVVDPTTKGISDSNRAMQYEHPNDDKSEVK